MNTFLLVSITGLCLLSYSLAVFGTLAVVSTDTRRAMWYEGLAHGGYPVAFWLLFRMLWSSTKSLMSGFDMELSHLMLWFYGLADLLVGFWYLLLLLVWLPGLLIDLTIFCYYHRHAETRFVARLISMLITLLLLVQGGLGVLVVIFVHATMLHHVSAFIGTFR